MKNTTTQLLRLQVQQLRQKDYSIRAIARTLGISRYMADKLVKELERAQQMRQAVAAAATAMLRLGASSGAHGRIYSEVSQAYSGHVGSLTPTRRRLLAAMQEKEKELKTLLVPVYQHEDYLMRHALELCRLEDAAHSKSLFAQVWSDYKVHARHALWLAALLDCA